MRSARREQYEPFKAEPRPLEYVELALQPIRRDSHSERRSFMSRRSVTECTDRTARRNSISEEPSQWATSTVSKQYASSPKEDTPLRKDLHYAGERVIMAIRVKGALSDTEKLNLMRAMLLKHVTSPDNSP